MSARRFSSRVIGRPTAALLAALLAVLAQLLLAPACAAAPRQAAVADCHAAAMPGMDHGRAADHAVPTKSPASERACGHCFAPPPVIEAQPLFGAAVRSPLPCAAPPAVAHEAPARPSPAAPPPSQAPPSLI